MPRPTKALVEELEQKVEQLRHRRNVHFTAAYNAKQELAEVATQAGQEIKNVTAKAKGAVIRTKQELQEVEAEKETLQMVTEDQKTTVSRLQNWLVGATGLAGLSLTASILMVAVYLKKHPPAKPQRVDVVVSQKESRATGHDTLKPMSSKPVVQTAPHRLASVRIGAGGGCSGTIIAIGEEHAYGISAAHCCNGVGRTFTFGNLTGTNKPARWIARDREVDLALFTCRASDVLATASVPEKFVPDWTQKIEAVGYPHTNGPRHKFLRYNRTHDHGECDSRGRRTGRTLRNRYCFTNLGPGIFASGDSGGGVFYDGSHLVAVMTHGDNIHCASLPTIVKFIKSNERKFNGAKPFN